MNTINTLAELESALDSGRLQAHMRHGKWWDLRRNGQTKRWKRDPNRFRLPVKAGLRSHYAFTESDLPLNYSNFRLRPEAESC